jgi:plastocyanin
MELMIIARRRRLVPAAALGIALITGLAGCGATNTTASPPAPSVGPSAAPTIGVIPSVSPIAPNIGLAPTPATATIRMYIDHPFDPATLTVAPATVITVINEGNEICNLTDAGHGIGSNDIGPGASAHMIAPDTPGTYNYDCTYYPDTMKGTLIVSKDITTPSSAGPATATPTATPTDSASPTAAPTETPASGSDTAASDEEPSDNGSQSSPSTPGGLAHPEKCRHPSFYAKHPNACARYGY